MKADYARDVELRDRRLKAVEEERDVLRGWHRRYETAALEIQELRGQLDAAVQARDEAKNEWRTDEIVRGEVARESFLLGVVLILLGQSESLVSLQNERNDLQAEVLELRKWKNEGDAKENAAKHIQRDLKDQIHALNLEVERTRNELE
jgi:hypothetical protein